MDHNIDKKRQELAAARRLLRLYDSPFPDQIEKRKRSEQLAYVKQLEAELERK